VRESLLFWAVTFLLVSVVVAAGCTTTTTNQTSTSTSSTAASHDAFLEQYMMQYHNTTLEEANYTLKAWEVKWLNSTTVNLVWTIVNSTSQEVIRGNETIMHFKSTDDATAYFNSLNVTKYTLSETIYPGGAYQDLTGHAPIPYKAYVKDVSVKQSILLFLLGDIVVIEEDTVL
jgi:hypothetical protein